MQTSLQGIAEKSARQGEHRFQNLMGLIGTEMLYWCWKLLNRRSAPGVDLVTYRQYGERLKDNITNLVERVKGGRYRAKLVKRRFIPKPGGKLRPLGIPATEDKLLQTAVAKILEAIYEPIFKAGSFGYRPNRGALDAIKEVSTKLQFGGFNYVVEADIRGFFDAIDHTLLIEMLEKKIDDKAFLGLIRKWLKAGVLEEGRVIDPITGTPQGGIVSPILANIYLHYVLDEWFEEVVKAHCGQAYYCRYADDFICAFQNRRDAERFYEVLGKRLEKFGLTLAEEKTRIIRFSRLHMEDKAMFEFLGFEFRWGTNRAGKPQLMRRTSRKRHRNSLERFGEWCRKNINLRMTDLFRKLNAKLRGYYNYYGVIGNYKSLASFYYQAMKILFKRLNRRSQRKSYNWLGFNELLKYFWIEKPRITEKKLPKQLEITFCV
jgi:group II intron reverse transcriptase/maturase